MADRSTDAVQTNPSSVKVVGLASSTSKKQENYLSGGAIVALSIVAVIAIAAICGGVLLITETVQVPDSETCTSTDHPIPK